MQHEGESAAVKIFPGVGHVAILLARSQPFREKTPVLDDTVAFIQNHTAETVGHSYLLGPAMQMLQAPVIEMTPRSA